MGLAVADPAVLDQMAATLPNLSDSQVSLLPSFNLRGILLDGHVSVDGVL